jgi:regulatory protein
LTASGADARKYSLKLLSFRGRSEKELRDKLAARGFDQEIISSNIDYLKTAGFIDDSLLAASLKRQACEIKLCGYKAAKQLMYKRGLSRDVIDAALAYDEELEFSTLQKLLDKKMRSMGKYHSLNDRKKLWNFLIRKGYSSGAIRKILKFSDCDEEVL